MNAFRNLAGIRVLIKTLAFLRRIFPLTRAGVSLAALSVLVAWLEGIRHSDLVVLSGAAIALVIEALLVFFVVVSAIAVRFAIATSSNLPPLDLETGNRQPTGFAVGFAGWLPFITFSWIWRSPASVSVEIVRKDGKLCEFLEAKHHLSLPSIEREFRLGDFLGLTQISWLAEEARAIRVLPQRAEGARFALQCGLAAGTDSFDPVGNSQGSLMEMREYRPGDSPRLIRWKLYAHTRKLIVRTPEPAIEEFPAACAWLAGGAASERPARLAREALESGLLGEDWGFGASGAHSVISEDVQVAFDRIAVSGNAPEVDTAEVLRFLGEAQAAGFGACFLLLPARSDLSPAIETIAARSPIELHAVLAESEPTRGPTGRAQKLFFRIPGEDPQAELHAATVKLAPFVKTVTVVPME